MHVLVVNFNLTGMTEQQYEKLCDDVAPAFAAAPGLLSKIWIKNSDAGIYGGIYQFRDRGAFQQFTESELCKSVASHPNFTNVTAHTFEVQEAPTRVTHGLAVALA